MSEHQQDAVANKSAPAAPEDGETTGPETGNDAPGISPPPAPTVATGGAGRDYGCLGCLAAVLLLLLLGWWLLPGGEPPAGDARALLPASTTFLARINDTRKLARLLESSPFWRRHQGREAVAEARDRLVTAIARELGDVRRRDVNDLLAQARSLEIAAAPGAGGRLAWAAFLHLEHPQQAMRILTEDMWLHQTKTRLGGVEVASIQRPGGGEIWYHAFGPVLLITPDASLIRFAMRAGSKGADETLAARQGHSPPTGQPEALAAVWCDLRELRRRQLAGEDGAALLTRALLPQEAVDLMLGPEQVRRLDAGALLELRLHAPAGRPWSVQVALRGRAPLSPGHGFWYYLLWVVLTPVILVFAILALVILITLLMAAWFYLVSWWKGELAPPAPPPPAAFSEQLEADLAGGGRAAGEDVTPGPEPDAPPPPAPPSPPGGQPPASPPKEPGT